MSPLLNQSFFRFTIGFMLILIAGFFVTAGVGYMQTKEGEGESIVPIEDVRENIRASQP